ncbi:hypothetical protein C1S99_26125 [Vibrio parahaemolyticus]|nr:DUF3265 domain-containing protein [Vibrio parahaemolyticus]PMS39176.1 hypothetical protein C1T12_25795 [Vibrio parahaemolyticus]PMS57774.1 hypothetical protein C1S91_25740 [Vibrio parahaemolyticus]PMS65188.1 hypothetical protein C1S96_26220 [Vibrio parahaemolyticus]PMS70442.1 hypothetical protein C1T10_25940 [Vibrio parahaemolyticus]
MTRRSSGIHAAWHFGFAVSCGGESGLRQVGLFGIHPLTRRYGSHAECKLDRMLSCRYIMLSAQSDITTVE